MKKFSLILIFVMSIFISALPVYAMGGGMGGMGGGGGMMGNWGSGLTDLFQRFQNRNDYNGPDYRDRDQMERLDQRRYAETANLKGQIQRKEQELEALLNAKDPDIDKIRALHGEIRGLRAELAERQGGYNLQTR